MLLFIEKTDGTVIHNVISIEGHYNGEKYKQGYLCVKVGNSFLEKEKEIDVLHSEILIVMSYDAWRMKNK